MRLVAWLIAVAIHLAVLAVILVTHQADKAKPTQASTVTAKLIPPEGDLKAMPAPGAITTRPKAGWGLAAEKCDGTMYRGIGIQTKISGYVFYVAENGPADQAGMRNGDWILNSEILETDRHPVGTRLALRVLRDGNELPITATVGNICSRHPKV